MLVAGWVGSVERFLCRLGEEVVVSASFAACSCNYIEVGHEHVQVHLNLLRWVSDLDLRIPAIRHPLIGNPSMACKKGRMGLTRFHLRRFHP